MDNYVYIYIYTQCITYVNYVCRRRASTIHTGVCEVNTRLDVAGVFDVPTPLP